MARRSGWFRRIIVFCIIVLACFGGYTLYQQNQEDVDSKYDKVSDKVKAVKKVLE